MSTGVGTFRWKSRPASQDDVDWAFVLLPFSEPAERGAEGGHQLRQLQNDDDDAVEKEPKRGARLQRLRIVLQAAQREYLFSVGWGIRHYLATTEGIVERQDVILTT